MEDLSLSLLGLLSQSPTNLGLTQQILISHGFGCGKGGGDAP